MPRLMKSLHSESKDGADITIKTLVRGVAEFNWGTIVVDEARPDQINLRGQQPLHTPLLKTVPLLS